MKKLATATAGFSLFFLLSGFALAFAQASPPDPTEPPSRLSMFVDDVTNWWDAGAEHIRHGLTNWWDHIGTGTEHISTDADHISSTSDHRPIILLTSPSLDTPQRGQPAAGASGSSTGLINTDAGRVAHSPPLPRPRPAELASAPVASKEKAPTPIQIND
jgi:hypothetical protein